MANHGTRRDVEVIFTPWPFDAVTRGVALLDRKVPGWRSRCSSSAPTVDLVSFNWWTECADPRHFGFAVPLEALHGGDYDELMGQLRDAWREAFAEIG